MSFSAFGYIVDQLLRDLLTGDILPFSPGILVAGVRAGESG